MVFTLFALLAGIGLGIVCSGPAKGRWLPKVLGRLGRAATAVLLLLIGLWMGANPAFWAGLHTTGSTGLALALAASAGSVALAWAVVRALFPGDRS